jgi:hypothetical protein
VKNCAGCWNNEGKISTHKEFKVKQNRKLNKQLIESKDRCYDKGIDKNCPISRRRDTLLGAERGLGTGYSGTAQVVLEINL